MARRGYSQSRAPREAPIRSDGLDGPDLAPHPLAMPPPNKPTKNPASEREAKLAQALRANLRRRKAGERAAGKPEVEGERPEEN
jgi:hypothetical protein